MKLTIKPLSVNKVWAGRRFKTPAYKEYERELFYLLPKTLKLPEGKIDLKIKWGMSSRGGDIDNPAKPFIDVLQKKYGFNDSRIYRLTLEKSIVPKGLEYVEFDIIEYVGV